MTLLAAIMGHVCACSDAGPPTSVFLEDLTWTEVRDALANGTTTIILPTGGTEQNGPHMALGKHNFIARHAAEVIALRLGNALVAPVLAYVPEGDVDPPSGHMHFPGTISLPRAHFEKVIEYAARSFRTSGFRDIVLIGDSGGNWAGLAAVAERLNHEWRGTPVRVHYIDAYNRGPKFADWLRQQGESDAAIGSHAGIMDTSVMLAVDPSKVRTDRLERDGGFPGSGVAGDPRRASAAYGEHGLKFQIDDAVAQIRRATTR